MTFVANTLFAALVIAFVSWLSGRNPILSGLIAAMPLSTMLILPLSQAQHGDAENTVLLAKSIFLATPVALLFFVPFLLAERLALPFWKLYAMGVGLLLAGFWLYRLATRMLFPEAE